MADRRKCTSSVCKRLLTSPPHPQCDGPQAHQPRDVSATFAGVGSYRTFIKYIDKQREWLEKLNRQQIEDTLQVHQPVLDACINDRTRDKVARVLNIHDLLAMKRSYICQDHHRYHKRLKAAANFTRKDAEVRNRLLFRKYGRNTFPQQPYALILEYIG